MVDDPIDFQKGAWYNIIVNVYDTGVRCSCKRARRQTGARSNRQAGKPVLMQTGTRANQHVGKPARGRIGTLANRHEGVQIVARLRGYSGTRIRASVSARVGVGR